MKHSRFVAALSLCTIVSAAPAWAQGSCGPPTDATTVRASVSSSGVMGNNTSRHPTISANGRWVAFESDASNLVSGDTNAPFTDSFVRDLRTNATVRISVSSSGAQGNAGGAGPAISADGRFVAFHSASWNLVPGDTNGAVDIFVHDRKTGVVRLASVSTTGIQGNDQSAGPRISGDGRFVVFNSLAYTLVPGDTNGFGGDVFVHDLLTGETERVSVSSGGGQSNGNSGTGDISGDGRYVAFGSRATNLVPGDTNATLDVFVHDRWTHETTRVSVSSTGAQGNGQSGSDSWAGNNPDISEDGRYVAFSSSAQNLVAGDTAWSDAFVHDRWTGVTTLVSKSSSGQFGNEDSGRPSLSAGGRYVAFYSRASNLVPSGTSGPNVFVHDVTSHTTERVSLAWNGSGVGVAGYEPSISADGRWIAFGGAGPAVPGPTNTWLDIFVRQRDLSAPLYYCAPKINSNACEPTIDYVGAPSSTAGSGFHVTVGDVLPGLNGSLVYSIGGAHNAPFAGGTLCIRPPLRFTPTQQAPGRVWPPSCSGTYDIDFNQWVAAGQDPGLISGIQVWVQYISRDPGFARPDSIALSDALTFVLCP